MRLVPAPKLTVALAMPVLAALVMISGCSDQGFSRDRGLFLSHRASFETLALIAGECADGTVVVADDARNTGCKLSGRDIEKLGVQKLYVERSTDGERRVYFETSSHGRLITEGTTSIVHGRRLDETFTPISPDDRHWYWSQSLAQ